MENSQLAKTVKALRQKKGFSQEQLAEESGLSLRTIQRIENGETQSTGATLKLLAKALSVNAEELLDWGMTEDTEFLVTLHLTALTFLVFPLLGTLVPAILWISKKDKVKGLNESARALINFEITWNLFLFGVPIAAGLFFWLSGYEVSFSRLIMMGAAFIILTFAYNLIQIMVNTARIRRGQPVKYILSIPFSRA